MVDTSAVQVNSARFDDRVDTLVSERIQNITGGKQKIGSKSKSNKKGGKFQSSKARSEEQEKKCAACVWKSSKRRRSL